MKTLISKHQALRLVIVVGLAALCLTVLLSWVSVSSAATIAPSSVGQDINAPNNGSVITIGIAVALSDPFGEIGGWRQANAVQLAISQTNEAGGVEIGGAFYTLTVVRVDSMCSDTEAVTAANTLLDAGAVVVVGHTCSGASSSAQPLYNAAGVAMVSPSSTSPQLTEEGYTTTFRVISRDDAGAILLATYFYDALGLDQAAIVEWNDVEWASDAFASTFAGLGGAITSRRTVTSTDDYTATLTTIKAEGPAAIYYAIPDTNDAGLLSRVAHNLGMDDLAMGWDSVWGEDLDTYAAAAGAATEGDYAALPYRRTGDMPGYDQLNAEYQAAGFPNHGDEAEMWGAFAYDAAQIIIAAIERADSAATLAIRDEIAATTDYNGVMGTYEGFDAKGDVIPQWTWMEQYQNGQWVRVRTTPTRTWYVHPNGLDSDTGTLGLPLKTIQYAIDRAEDGDLILVAAGAYTENLTIDKMLTLRGGYTMSGTAWLPDTGETVVDGSGSQTVLGDWDSNSIYAPTVITDGGVYKMWYTGSDMFDMQHIGYAESADGVNWTRPITTPVLDIGDPGDWDEKIVGQPSVVKQGSLYQMWFFAGDDKDIKQIGYATSTNGLDWTKYAGNPVLTVGAEGEWDETEVGGPRVLFDGATYRLWYHGYSGKCCDSIGYATSPDGVNWTKHPGNPVFGPGDSGEWDDNFVFFTAVISRGGQLQMWYSTGGGNVGIGYVTSTNGISWTRFLTGPVLSDGGPGEWDENFVFAPAVVHDSDYGMWYTSNGQFGYATSTDGIAWTKSVSNPVLTHGTPGQWGDPVVRFEGGDGSVLDGFAITGGVSEVAGGVYVDAEGIIIRHCLIRNNFAAGPQAWGGGGVLVGDNVLTILDSRIIDNQVNQGAGGVRVGEGPLIMVNTLVADNYGDAGLHLNGGATLMNVTVVGNDGGVIFNPEVSATLLITNSIVYDNGWSISDHGTGTAQVTYSDVEDGWTGTGNIDADPQFVDAANGDYHLKPGSPCIDTGTSVGAPATDIEGAARDATPDMGAYEWSGFRIFLPLVLRNF